MDNRQETTRLSNETELDLVQLLVEILKSVRQIFICAVICGILLGGLKLGWNWFSEYRAKNTPDEENTALDKYGVGGMVGVAVQEEDGTYKTKEEREYEQKMENYSLQAASYDDQLSKVLKLISRNEEYKRKSVLLNMDSNNFCQKDAVWYVDTHYQVSPGLSMQNPNPIFSIMSAYSTLLSSEEFYTYVHENITEDIDALYIRELIFTDANPDTSLIRVTALGASEQMTGEIFDACVQYLESHKPQIDNAVSQYDVMLIEKWDYGSLREGTSESIIGGGYADYIKQKQDSFNDTLAELQTAAVELQQKLLKLEEPKRPSSRKPLHVFIKNGVIGGIVGAVLGAVYVAISFILRDAALSEDELHKRYGVFVLASVKRFPGKGRWQRMLAKLCGDRKRAATLEEAVGLAKANVEAVMAAGGWDDQRVLLIGRDPDALAELERLAGGGENGFAAGGDITMDQKAVETLRGYENVVLAERKETTSYREIGGELETLARFNKRVVGLIAL